MTSATDAFLSTSPAPSANAVQPPPAKPQPKKGVIARAAETAVAAVVAAVAGPTPNQATRADLLQIEKELNGTFAEREAEIRGLLIALMAREHVLILGPAGTGKSALANVFCSALGGAQYFEWLLTRFSTPEELFGPVSLDGLKHDRFRRVVTGKLPEAHVGFLDEIFKANSAVLNSLLTALNERAFDNDGGRSQIPLETVVGASNELPEGPELAALYDRFLLRYWTDYTKTPAAFERLLTGAEPSITTTVGLADVKAAQLEVDALPIDPAAVEELFKLRAEMATAGVVISDRRWRKAVRILRAAAWLDGFASVTPDVFPILAHVLWDKPDERTNVIKLVSRYTSAELAEAQEAFDAAMQMLGTLPPDGDEKFGAAVTNVARELKKAQERLGSISARATAKPNAKARIDSLATEMDARIKDVKKKAAKALGL